MIAKGVTIHPPAESTQSGAVANVERQSFAQIEKGRIQFLDVLRGIAALMVVTQHAVEAASPGFVHWTNRFINFGEVGVVVFFIVSGFIIPVSLERYNSLERFWFGRVLRLWPAYVTSLFCAMAIQPLAHELPEYYGAHPVLFVLGNLTMFGEYLRIPLAIGAYWTLSLELVFYLLCSMLFLFGNLGRTRLWLALSALSLLLAQTSISLVLHRSLPAGRLGLFVTALFGTLLFRELKQRPSKKTVGTAVAGVFLCFVVCFRIRFDLYPPVTANLSPTVPPVHATGAIASWMCAYMLFLAIMVLRGQAFPRVFIWVGQISYPLYLFHGLILALMPKHLSPLLLLAAVLTASLPVAHAVHIWIEKPVGRFQHKLLLRKAVLLHD